MCTSRSSLLNHRVGATDRNPSEIIEYWKIGSVIKEGDCCYCVMDGHTHEHPFTFLFGGTQNGQILTYTRYGTIGKRYPLHTSRILKMEAYGDKNLLVVLSADHVFHFFKVCPDKKDGLQPLFTLLCSFKPVQFKVCDTVFVVGGDEGDVIMYALDETKAVMLPCHPKIEDHTESISIITYQSPWPWLITLGKDAMIKVWNFKNELLRELVFDQVPSHVCFLNTDCDILLTWEDQIDVIRGQVYLTTEQQQHLLDHPITSNVFPDILLPLNLDSVHPMNLPKKPPNIRHVHWMNYFHLGPYQEKTSLNAKSKPEIRLPHLFSEERDLFSEKKSSMSSSSFPSSSSPTKELSDVQSDVDILIAKVMMTELDSQFQLSSATKDLLNPASDSQPTTIQEVEWKLPVPRAHVPLCTLGTYPNTPLQVHFDQYIQAKEQKIRLRKVKKEKTKTLEEQKQTSEAYKERLQHLLAMMPREATTSSPSSSSPVNPPPPPIPTLLAPSPRPLSSTSPSSSPTSTAHDPLIPRPSLMPGPSGGVGSRRGTLRTGTPFPFLPPPSSMSFHLPSMEESAEESKSSTSSKMDLPEGLPKLIEKAMEFHIFQEKQLFEYQSTHAGFRRTWVVDPTPDGLLPLLLQAFKSSDMLMKKEVANFMSWMHEEYQFRLGRRLLETYVDFLNDQFLNPVDSLGQDVVMQLLRALPSLGMEDAEVIVTFLMYSIFGDGKIEAIVFELLDNAGFKYSQHPHVQAKLTEMVFKAKSEAGSSLDIVLRFRGYILAWLRRLNTSDPNIYHEMQVGNPKKKGKKRKGKKKKGTCFLFINLG
ncbi:WD repeat-containing protein 87 [Coelomomyces lativittatus]|nr:WD repeat-containing protein 87 [Coelomomyces lativittatus]